jgi:cytidine deaminase
MPEAEQRAKKQLDADNAALRRQIEEREARHLSELKAMRVQLASLSARAMPPDGCANCRRRIRELERENKRLQDLLH